MGKQMLRCPYCGSVPPPGATYCPFCGEAVDPALVAELQWLYGALNDLDTRIARGEGGQTIATLRDAYRDRYLTARRAPAPAPAVSARSSGSAASMASAMLTTAWRKTWLPTMRRGPIEPVEGTPPST